MLYSKIQVLCFHIFCIVYSTCLGYAALLASGIYAQSIQSAQIEFSALNAINVLYEICTSCHNTCNICRKIVIIIYYFIYIFTIILFLNKTL